jgi:hypothetical protein
MKRHPSGNFKLHIEHLAETVKAQKKRHELASGGKVSSLEDVGEASIPGVEYLRKQIYRQKRVFMEILKKLPEECWLPASLLVGTLICDAAMLGSYLIDTPRRQSLERRRIGRKCGTASGKTRTESAAKKWQDRAVDMANEIRAKKPGFSVAAIARNVETRWSGNFPVGFRRLYDFLRTCKKGDIFEKK